jgi:hypothetical protein
MTYATWGTATGLISNSRQLLPIKMFTTSYSYQFTMAGFFCSTSIRPLESFRGLSVHCELRWPRLVPSHRQSRQPPCVSHNLVVSVSGGLPLRRRSCAGDECMRTTSRHSLYARFAFHVALALVAGQIVLAQDFYSTTSSRGPEVSWSETAERVRHRLEVYSPSQVLQTNGCFYHSPLPPWVSENCKQQGPFAPRTNTTASCVSGFLACFDRPNCGSF